MYRTFRLPKLSFLGAGVLAEALAKGFIASGTVQIHRIWASAPTERDTYKMKLLGCNTTTDNIGLIKENNLVALVVKPQILPKVLQEIAPYVTPEHILLSFAAGVNIQTMESLLPAHAKVVRLMSNTPVQFMEGTSSFSLGTKCNDKDRTTVSNMMNAIGYCNEVNENILDVVTGFAGGGPAYIYCIVEAIADGAVLGGLQRDEALKMATQCVLGAATMLAKTKQHPGQLKDAVCSAGGTTIYGIQALENEGVRGSIINAIKAATHRSKELGAMLNAEISNSPIRLQPYVDLENLEQSAKSVKRKATS